MPINWQDKNVADRLLAAIIASHKNQINCAEVARLFGQGASYDAIEGFLRKPKKVATQLMEEAEGTPCPMKTPRKAKRSAVTPSPRKKRDLFSAEKGAAAFSPGVKSGRVQKHAMTAKSPRKEQQYIKAEQVEVIELNEDGDEVYKDYVEAQDDYDEDEDDFEDCV